jgi:hypothetical protein
MEYTTNRKKIQEDQQMTHEKEAPFYGFDIIRSQQQEYVNRLMKKYQNEVVNEELKKKVWNELQMEKYLGNVTIPFKLAVRMDPYGNFPNAIEVILDTKV